MAFLTNHPEFVASSIARIYKGRWQIDFSFKAHEQNLRIKTLIGISPNALQTRGWTALIALAPAQVFATTLLLWLESV